MVQQPEKQDREEAHHRDDAIDHPETLVSATRLGEGRNGGSKPTQRAFDDSHGAADVPPWLAIRLSLFLSEIAPWESLRVGCGLATDSMARLTPRVPWLCVAFSRRFCLFVGMNEAASDQGKD